MAESRRLKSLLGQVWFKSKRGGQSVTPLKDLPHYQHQEKESRKEGRKPIATDVRGARKGSPAPSRKQGREQEDTKVKEVETVVFVPATPDSALKTILQNQDNNICIAMNSPQVRFIEEQAQQ